MGHYPGSERLLYAGLLEHEIAEQYRRDGIPLNDETLAGVARAAEDLGVDATPLTAGGER